MLQAFVFVAILSPLCLAPGADALFLKKKIKLLKATKGKFGLRPQPQPHHAVGPAYLPPPQWVPPPHVVPYSGPPPVAHWGYPGEYSGWVPPPPQPAPPPAHGWVAGPPTVHAAHPPPQVPQGPPTTYVVEAQVPTGTAFASAAGKGVHRPKGQHEYQYTLQCPYELYVQVEPNANKDRW